VLRDGLFLFGVGIGLIVWGGLAWSGKYRGWTDNPISRTSTLAAIPGGVGMVLLGIFDLLSVRGRFFGYLVGGCFILAFLFLLITPAPLGPTWYRQLQKKNERSIDQEGGR
jgi:hypothetical protein